MFSVQASSTNFTRVLPRYDKDKRIMTNLSGRARTVLELGVLTIMAGWSIRCSLFATPSLTIDPQTSVTSSGVRSSDGNRSFHTPCPDALEYFSEADLERAIRDALDFHVRGGNLVSIQEFKDSAMDSTLQKMGLVFVPDDAKAGPTNQSVKYLRDYFENHNDARGGYGRPLPGKWSNERHEMLFEKRWFDVVEPREGRVKWDAALGPIGPSCQLQQLGPTGTQMGIDGTKFVCQTLVPKNNTAADQCHILSIGGNDNWKFEDAVRKQLDCVTHTFDCTLPNGTPRRKPKDSDMRFYNYCIDGTTHSDVNGRQFIDYAGILDKSQLARMAITPILLKLDVEGFEYDFFTSMLRGNAAPSSLPQQIAVELHWGTRMTGLRWMLRTRSSAEIAMFMSTMFTAGGYLPVHTEFSPGCTSCMEVLFFRVVCPRG